MGLDVAGVEIYRTPIGSNCRFHAGSVLIYVAEIVEGDGRCRIERDRFFNGGDCLVNAAHDI